MVSREVHLFVVRAPVPSYPHVARPMTRVPPAVGCRQLAPSHSHAPRRGGGAGSPERSAAVPVLPIDIGFVTADVITEAVSNGLKWIRKQSMAIRGQRIARIV